MGMSNSYEGSVVLGTAVVEGFCLLMYYFIQVNSVAIWQRCHFRYFFIDNKPVVNV